MFNTKRIIVTLLIAALLCGLLPCFPASAASVDTQYYESYGTILKLYNLNGCTGMQGMTVDDQYLYNVKVNSATETSAFIARTNKDTGSTVYLTDSSTGSQYFSYLGHANDLELDTIAGVDTMFIATSTDGDHGLVRMVLEGTTLTKVGNYTTTYNGTATAISSAKVLSKNETDITLLIKKGKYLYTTTVGVYDTTGTLELKHAFTLDTANVTINGVCNDFSDYLGQGFEYIDGKIFVPMACADPMNKGCIAVYHIEGASGTIRNDPTLSFWIESSTYASKFELESCAICPSDGILYFNTNAAVTSSDADHDGIHYVESYVYDPAHWTPDTGSYRWETQNDQLNSVSNGPSRWNNALLHAGQISDGAYTDVQYALSKSVRLEHDKPWIVEWKSTGKWTTGSLLFSSSSVSKYEGNYYIFRRKDSSLIALGEYTGGKFYNYGVTLSDHGIDGTAEHVYTLCNRINADGSNMVYLSVDGEELGPMNNYHIAGTSQGTTSDWVNGKDFTFSYMGTSQHPLSECNISYIQVWGNGLADQYDEPDIFRWETANDTLTGCSDFGFVENAVSMLYGSCADGVYTDAQYELNEPVVLLHDRPWSVEWCSEGAWTGGSLLLAGAFHAKTANAPILYRRQDSTLIAFGMYDGAQFNNYGVNLSDHGIDGTVKHTYRLTNRIAADGSNMVYLYVDGVELGAMNNYHIGGTSQNTTSDWLNGQDLVFSYLGTYQMPINDCSLDYLQIWENGIPAEDTPDRYRWDTVSDTLVSSAADGYTLNEAAVLSGSCSDGQYSGSHFALENSVVLLHDRSWYIEWESSGTWKDNANGSLLLTSALSGNAADAMYLYRRGNSEIIAFGERLNSKHHNYGIKLSDHSIDGTASHVYRLWNEVADDGSNMVYLSVDGTQLGAMNNYYIGGVSQGSTSDWISGKDFVFSYLGAEEFHIGNCAVTYLEVCESASATVQFKNWDGSLLSSDTYQLGQSVTVPEAPTRPADQVYTYTFAGWDQEVTACKGDTVYTAVYTAQYIDYTVTFLDWDGSILSSTVYHYGDSVSQPAAPSRSADELYTYTFTGWDQEVTDCTGNAVYTAQYSATEILHPTITPKYPTISFEDEVLMNVYFTAEDLGEPSLSDFGLVIWSTPQTTGTVENAETVTAGASFNASNSYYCVTTPGIPAKNIGDTIYFKIYVKLSDGSYLYSDLLSYSPKTYADNILATSNNTQLNALVVAMLNYGAQAQTYFNYKPYDLMNTKLTTEQQALVDAYREDMIGSVKNAASDKIGAFASTAGSFSKKYPTVSFEGAFAINYYFVPAYVPENGLKLHYWLSDAYDAADVLTADNASGVLNMESNQTDTDATAYTAIVEGIAAKNLEDTVYVAVVYSEGSNTHCSGVLAYSIGSYCQTQITSGSASMKPFAEAIAVYGYYARCYFS